MKTRNLALTLGALLGTPLQASRADIAIVPETPLPYEQCSPKVNFASSAHISPQDAFLIAHNYLFAIDSTHADFVLRLIDQESSYVADAVSELGAVGLGQLMRDAATDSGLRVATPQMLECLITAYGGVVQTKVPLTLQASRIIPIDVLEEFHEPFNPQKNVEATYATLKRYGLGKLPDHIVAQKYIAGPTNYKNKENIGINVREYPGKIALRNPYRLAP